MKVFFKSKFFCLLLVSSLVWAAPPDDDGDGIANGQDNCVSVHNPDQTDDNTNSIGDVCEDIDGDGSPYSEEVIAGTSDNDATQRPYWSKTFAGDATSYQASMGISVASAGDVNNDGYPDIIAGAPYDDANGTNTGMVRVFSGRDGADLYSFYGSDDELRFGTNVAGVGDLNSDGYDDLIVGHREESSVTGTVWVYSGVDGTIMYTLNGDDVNDYFGSSMAGVGDINSDGYADFVVGARGDSDYAAGGGSIRIFSGVDGSIIRNEYGNDSGDQFGKAVASAGDVNNDGYPDIIVGAITDENEVTAATPGSATVYSGLDGSILYTFFGGDYSGEQFGSSVAGAGDVNNDGYADLVIGAPKDNDNTTTGGGSNSGSAQVYSGIDGALLYDFEGQADQNLGNDVSAAGDINGDGYDDILIGVFGHDSYDRGQVRIYNGVDGKPIYFLNVYDPWIRLGYSVSTVGDVDMDGYPDLIMGAPGEGLTGVNQGTVRVVLAKDLFNDVDADLTLNDYDDDDDGDGMPDTWEITYGLDPLDRRDADADLDGDGYTNLQEYQNSTDPTVWIPPTGNDDYVGNDIAGIIWKGEFNGVEGKSRIWTPDWGAATQGWVVPSRTYPPDWDASLVYDIATTGDFDGDGDADWLWRARTNGDGRWRVWCIESGYRNCQQTLPVWDANHDFTVAGTGDTDRDGDADVVLFNGSTGEVVLWEMENSNVINTHSIRTQSGYDVVRVGDFDADNDVDLLLQLQGGNTLRFWEIEGNTFVRQITTGGTGSGFVTQCAGDFNGDGHDDVYLLAADGTSKWFHYVDFIRQLQKYGANQSVWKLYGCADYDGDGDADTFWGSASGDGLNRFVLVEDFLSNGTYYSNKNGATVSGQKGYGYEYRGSGN